MIEPNMPAYIAGVAKTRSLPGLDLSTLRIAYTPMPGVGGKSMLKTLHSQAIDRVACVAEQFEPDPKFSTVAFPNPEEPGALYRLFNLARKEDIDLAVAQQKYRPPKELLLGFEEALGFSVGSLVRDKDGLSAGVFVHRFAPFERLGFCGGRVRVAKNQFI